MDRDSKYAEIIKAFNESAENFSRRCKAHCDFETRYKRNIEKPSQITHHYAKIYFNTFIIMFEYTAHGFMSMANSILSCYISFEKTEGAILYPMYSVMDVVDMKNFDSYIIPHITNGQIMKQCFTQIARSLEKYIDDFKALSDDPLRKNILFDNLLRDLSVFFKANITSDNYTNWLNQYYPLYINRFTLNDYTHVLTGNYKKAIKGYMKMKNKLLYEHRLLEELSQRIPESGISEQNGTRHEEPLAAVPQEIRDNISKYSNTGKIRGIIPLYVSWLVIGILWAIPFCAFYYILLEFEKSNALYITGPDIFAMFLPSFMMGIVSSYYARRLIYKIINRKDYEKRVEMDLITNGPGSDKIMRTMGIILLVVSIIFTVLVVKCNVIFQEDYIVDNRNFFSLKSEYYSYSQVSKVYYKASRTNDMGGVIEWPSYVIVFENDSEIDLYDFEDVEKTEKYLIPILKEKGIKIEK